MDKALNLDCDAVVLDLEDAVEVSKKEDSRQLVIRQIENNDYGLSLIHISEPTRPY